MIVSHKHKFIFMHSLKTAGTSLTIALSRHLAAEDYMKIDRHTLLDFCQADVVPRSFLNEKCIQALEEHGELAAQKYALRVLKEGTFQTSTDRLPISSFAEALRKAKQYKADVKQHATALQVKNFVGTEVWNSYHKFAFERNPWDRMVSFYSWRWNDRKNSAFSEKIVSRTLKPTFRSFILGLRKDGVRAKSIKSWYLRNYRHSNWPIYAINNSVSVDSLFRYEDFDKAILQISNQFGIDLAGNMPQAKVGITPRRKDNPYDQEMVQHVAEVFHREISALGYELPQKYSISQ